MPVAPPKFCSRKVHKKTSPPGRFPEFISAVLAIVQYQWQPQVKVLGSASLLDCRSGDLLGGLECFARLSGGCLLLVGLCVLVVVGISFGPLVRFGFGSISVSRRLMCWCAGLLITGAGPCVLWSRLVGCSAKYPPAGVVRGMFFKMQKKLKKIGVIFGAGSGVSESTKFINFHGFHIPQIPFGAESS